VALAMQLAEERGFDLSCTPEVGRLLHLLAGHQRSGVVGEMGTGCGVGAAWMATALQPDVTFVTIEQDPERAAAAATLLRDIPKVRVIRGDWREILPYGPFGLLFVDAAEPKRERPGEAIEALAPGGMIVLDDLTPEERRPEEWRGRPDPVREIWLRDPRLTATEILVTPDMAVILAIRNAH
jgi:predicted O-methyltransferase YrrM